MNSTPRTRLLVGGISVIIIILIIIIFAIDGKRDVVLESNAQPKIEAAIYGESTVDKNGMILREIARDGDWVVVITISVRASDYGNNSTVILKKDREEYKIVYQGTAGDEEYLKNLGTPEKIIQATFHNDQIGKYVESATNSDKSPYTKYPIIKHLPISKGTYSISYGYDDEYDIESFYLLVAAPSGYRNAAVKEIYNLGFDPADYTIKFSDYINPFEEVDDAK